MNDFRTWEDYFLPPPHEGTLRNLLNEIDPGRLASAEQVLVSSRAQVLRADPSLVHRSFDAEHVRTIHWYLFQDVYPWAGQFRQINIFKGSPGGFADASDGSIDRYIRDASRIIREVEWEKLDRDGFSSEASRVFAYVNQAHPFREGNGRASKVFMEHVADLSCFSLDYSQVTEKAWNQASRLSGPDLESYEPIPDSLVPIFQKLSHPRKEERVERLGKDDLIARIQSRTSKIRASHLEGNTYYKKRLQR